MSRGFDIDWDKVKPYKPKERKGPNLKWTRQALDYYCENLENGNEENVRKVLEAHRVTKGASAPF